MPFLVYIPLFITELSIWLKDNYIEFVATIFSIAGVWLTTKQIIWCWPVALIGLLLSVYVFYLTNLYLQVLLQIFYIVMTVYGWYYWKYGGKNNTEPKITNITKKMAINYIVSGLLCTIIAGYLFNKFTKDPQPILDALTSVCGIIATYLMAKKIIEHWIIWIFNDIIVVWMCYYQKLYIFTFLYFIFVILATYGLFEWKKDKAYSQ